MPFPLPELGELIDAPGLQSLVDDFYDIARLPTGIIDMHGRVLVGAGWQDICTQFHRINPDTCRACIESDTQLVAGIAHGEFRRYRCKNNMWDVATPIVVRDRHVGNVFSGQFFFEDEPIDYEGFREQARRYGFDEEAYIAALGRVPRLSRQAVDRGMSFFVKLAHMVSRLGDANVTLAQTNAQREADIAERNRLEAELQEHVRSLAEANRLKDEFLSTLSHELRTPLNAVLGWSQLLLDGRLDPADGRKALEAVHRNAMAQLRLVEDVLDVSRIVSGRLRLDITRVSIGDCLDAALDAIRPAAAAKQIEISAVVDRGVTVVGDPDRLQQVFWNLLSNAVKFTPQGGRVQVASRQAAGHAVLEVRDSGIGITAEFLPHLFQRFRQADGSMTRSHGGLGLGLAIVRHLVEMHGGEVRAASAGEGHGATFTITLPVLSAAVPSA